MADSANQQPRWNVLRKIVRRLTGHTAYYGTALGALVIAGTAQDFPSLVANVGAGAFGILIERMMRDEDVLDDEIRQIVSEAIQESKIENLLTEKQFFTGFWKLFRELKANTAISNEITSQLGQLLVVYANLDEKLDTTNLQLTQVHTELQVISHKTMTVDQLEEVLARYFNAYLSTVTAPTPPTPKKTSVFLSYARADDHPDYDDASKSFVRRLYESLKDEFDVWWDRKSLASRGEEFTKELQDAIHDCDRFVLIVAPAAVASKYVRAEWEYALSQCKSIMLVLRAGEHDLIPKAFGLSDINAIDARPTRDEATAFNDIAQRLTDPDRLGTTHAIKPLPKGYITRPALFDQAFDALKTDAIKAAVISAPAKKETPASAVAVYGMGGIGKSTMAAALAEDCRIRRHFYDGVIWLEVGQTPNLTSLQAALGGFLGDDGQSYTEENGNVRLSGLLQDKHVLIILDDVWQSKAVEKFPVHGTPSRLLITTRSGKLARDVHGEDIKLTTLTPDEGARLIAARLTDSGKEADPADPDSAAISAFLEGHTLAVALAAAQIAQDYVPSPAEMLRLLKKRAEPGVEPFKDLVVNEDDKDKNLALSLSLSYDALKPDLRRRFRATGIFALEGSFPLEALAAVWGDDDADDARAPLTALLGAGLLEPADAEGRTTQHRVLRAYARALLIENGELEDVFARYADWVIAATPYFSVSEMATWSDSDWLLPHIFEVGDALTETYADTHPDKQAALMDLVRYVFLLRGSLLGSGGNPYARLAWYERAIDHLRTTDQPQRLSNLLFSVGSLYDRAGLWDKMLAVLEESLQLNIDQDNPRSIAVTQNSVADLYFQQGRWDDALALYEASLKTIQQLNDPREIAVTQSKIADLYFQQGRWDDALTLYEASLKTQKQLNDPREIAVTQSKIADLYVKQGRWNDALVLYEASLKTIQQLNDPREIAVTQSKIADLYFQQGRWDDALALYEASLKTSQQLNDPRSIAVTQSKIADLYFQQGRWDDALALYEAALKTKKQLNDPREIVVTQNSYGQALILSKKDVGLGVEMIWQSYMGMERFKNPREIQMMREILGQVKQLLGAQFDTIWASRIAVPQPDWLANTAQPQVSTLPKDVVQELAGNTVAVKTGVPDKLGEWRETLTGARSQFAGRGDDWANEVAFADALLAILDDQPPVIAPENPYAGVIRQVVQNIDKHQAGSGDDTSSKPDSSTDAAQPSQEEQFAQVIQQLKGIYDQHGADAVREILVQNGLPSEVIELILAQLAALPSGGTSAPQPQVSTLPKDVVQELAGNTVAVKTGVPDKLGEWRETLTGARSQFAGRGDDWANEVAFADALLAILDDQPPVIAPDNPYAGVIDRVVEAIGKYRIGR